MKKTIDYTLLEYNPSGLGGLSLEQQVISMIKKGYTPLGGVAVGCKGSGIIFYLQAMVKYEK